MPNRPKTPMTAAAGIANNIPVNPNKEPPASRDKITQTGWSLIFSPTNLGVTKFPSTNWPKTKIPTTIPTICHSANCAMAIEVATMAVIKQLNVLKKEENNRLSQYESQKLFNHKKIHIGDIKAEINAQPTR